MNAWTKKAALAGALLVPALCCLAGAARAQALPLDDKARYEKALEQKVDEVLLRLLGRSQAKVGVEAAMDFSRTEKVDVTTAEGAGKGGAFKWQSAATGGGQPMNDMLLPGFPSLVGGEPENKTYQKQFLFPSSFVKRLNVSVIINRNLSEAEAQNVRSVVSEVLGLDQGRGDSLAVIRTPFAPFWKTIWYSPEALNMVFKYGILSIIGIISMIVVAIGFLKLAGAMNTMARAQQSHQITMDLGRGAMGGGAGGGLQLPGLGGESLEAGGEKKAAQGVGEFSPAAEDGLFNVRPEQVDFLVGLMSGEDPGNIALVAGHLAEDVKSDFLRKLPREVSADVVASLAQMRFVEPEVISTIREELERRLSGAFGGVGKAVAALEKASLRDRKSLYESLASRHPDLAGEVRPRIFLADDLAAFGEKDMSIIATAVKIEDWATALPGLPPVMREKLKSQLTEKAWAMLEQTMKYGSPSAAKVDAAVETVAAAVMGLVSQGRVASPVKAAAGAGAALPAQAKGGVL